MSDDEADPELLELLRETLGLGKKAPEEISSETVVLKDAEFIYDNAIDVSIDMIGAKAAATSIYSAMQQRNYSTQTWSEHELHPSQNDGFSEVDLVNFVFTLDLWNFSFFSDRFGDDQFKIEYRGKMYSGYKALVACLRRAIDEDIPITTPRFWNDPKCSDEMIRHVFRSATIEEMPLIPQRISILREAASIIAESFAGPDESIQQEDIIDTVGDESGFAPDGQVTNEHSSLTTDAGLTTDDTNANENAELMKIEATQTIGEIHAPEPGGLGPSSNSTEPQPNVVVAPQPTDSSTRSEIKSTPEPDLSIVRLVQKSDHSAGKLVNLIVKHFPCFRDETRFDGRRVRIFKRAQIFVADLWAAFNGTSYGHFHDIGRLTVFADYRIPQMLHALGVLVYSPPLDYAVRNLREIESGHSWEVQLRGCSIWAVELIRREILRQHPEAMERAPTVLIDFFLYDLAKEKEASAAPALPHHRTRTVWY